MGAWEMLVSVSERLRLRLRRTRDRACPLTERYLPVSRDMFQKAGSNDAA